MKIDSFKNTNDLLLQKKKLFLMCMLSLMVKLYASSRIVQLA